MSVYELVSKDDKRGLIVECACHMSQHQMELLYWSKDDEPALYFSPQLSPLRFWRRLWLGIKYILGYRSRYGDYGELVLFKKDVQMLQDFLEGFLKKS